MKKYVLYGMVGFVLMSIIIGMLSKELKEPNDLMLYENFYSNAVNDLQVTLFSCQ